MVNTFGTGNTEESRLVDLVREHFPLTPKGMIDHLKLRRPIYRKTAAFGHFGRKEATFSWEAADKAAALRAGAQVAAVAR
jgi:S-adenosylmethionine synthetase